MGHNVYINIIYRLNVSALGGLKGTSVHQMLHGQEILREDWPVREAC